MNTTIALNMMLLLKSNWTFPHHFIKKCRNTTDITTFLVSAYSLETLLGILGNMCLIGLLARQKEKAIITNIFITNLVLSDLIMCIFCLPLTLVTILLNYWIFGEAMCKITSFIQCTSMTVSILSLVLIALERYQLIINPTGWRPSLSQAYLGIAAIWIFASLLSLPFMINSTFRYGYLQQDSYKMDTKPNKTVCTCTWPSEEYRLTYVTALLQLQYCIPLILILVCYLRIYLRLQKRKGMFEKREYSCRLSHLKQINILLISMVVAFAACWLPLHIFNSIDDWNYKMIPPCFHDLIFSLCHLVAMASVCVNPIIYGFLNKNFKKEVKALILICQHHSSVQEYDHLPLSTKQTEVSKGSQRLSCQQDPI